MFDRPDIGERAVLVHLDLNAENQREYITEFEELALSAGAKVCDIINARRHVPDARYFVGKGKAEEIAGIVEADNIELVLFNHALSPSQERNLEALFQCRVLDRTGLILDIFSQRARTFEGKLQVELAQLKHLSTRLIRGWTHLERQKGGIGLRGPGETQLETDRRLLSVRIKQIKRRLEKVRKQREQGRQSRRKAEVPTVAFVGYTNAGKSTLFNALTNADVYVQDQLFATLDPTLRKFKIDDGSDVILADTVGFIRHLPHDLVESFRSTLQETEQAHLLFHIIDASDDMRLDNINAVETVLHEIGAMNVPQIQIMNKIDRLGLPPRIDRDESGKVKRIWVSAIEEQGLDLIHQVLAGYFKQDIVKGSICLSLTDARIRALLYDIKAVEVEKINEQGQFILQINIPKRDLFQMISRESIAKHLVLPDDYIENVTDGYEIEL
ncbi:Ribosome LSU-associated GTP-binding protein HflX [hydrothermal vent metagenome]|uniref:Ribosome LSU-associated GTP-binding protein HflX n=1 Tax=hydrothermal vent metagenome TaxID=652676 RepID=A0A3B0WUM5_9ZZZZ